MKSAIFITARMKSTRLPRKLLLDIKGKSVIEHLIERLKLAKLPELIVLCTSTNPDDDVLVDVAKRKGIEYFRGSENDVLDRFLHAALKFKLDFIVVTWGDELFCDPEYVDKTIKLYGKTNADFIKCEELPLGTFSYGVKVDALKKVVEIKDEEDTEIWGGYFEETELFKVEILKVEDENLKHPEIRMTLDYPQDYEFMKEIFDRLYLPDRVFTLREVIHLLKKHPELTKINRDMQRSYEKRIKDQTKIKVKLNEKSH